MSDYVTDKNKQYNRDKSNINIHMSLALNTKKRNEHINRQGIGIFIPLYFNGETN